MAATSLSVREINSSLKRKKERRRRHINNIYLYFYEDNCGHFTTDNLIVHHFT
jgi:hypothetical protein